MNVGLDERDVASHLAKARERGEQRHSKMRWGLPGLPLQRLLAGLAKREVSLSFGTLRSMYSVMSSREAEAPQDARSCPSQEKRRR